MTVSQNTGAAQPGTQITRPLPPYTFILDGQRLRQLRRQRGLSQNELADQAEVSLTTVARLERQRTLAAGAGPSAASPEHSASTPRP